MTGVDPMVSAETPLLDTRVLPYQKEQEAYELPGRCLNCDWRGAVLIAKGEEAPGRRGLGTRSYAFCDRCGCSKVTTEVKSR